MTRSKTASRDRHLSRLAARVLAGTVSPAYYASSVRWIYEAMER